MFDERSFEKPRLILRYFRNELTAAEEEELNEWLREDARNRLLMNSLLHEIELQRESRFFSSLDLSTGWEKVLVKAARKRKQTLTKPFIRWRVAAAIVGILIVGCWATYQWIWKNRLPEPNIEMAEHDGNDIPPGGDKARLTLHDGSVIKLEKTGKGKIPEQHGVRISNREGELEYRLPAAGEQPLLVYNTLSTPKGGQYRLVLPDGSRVWLNSASSLRFPVAFSAHERQVELSGEAYFEITPDKTRPFLVSVPGRTEVEVLGTHLNVMAYEEEESVQATLLEGVVKITPLNGRQYLTSEARILHPGQQASVRRATASLTIAEVDTAEIVAWKEGLFWFSNDHIRAVMKQISRWYNVEVHYEGKLPETEFTGMISRKVNISQVLNMLERTGGVQFRIEGRNVVVIK